MFYKHKLQLNNIHLMKRYGCTVEVGIHVKFSCASQNPAFKNHPRDILRNENHLYGIVLVHIMHKTALNTTKQVAGYRILKITKTLNFRLTA